MIVHSVKDADVLGNNPIYHNGELVGRATSGGYGFRINESLALAMVRPEAAAEGTKLTIEILGESYDATICEESPFDPQNERPRA